MPMDNPGTGEGALMQRQSSTSSEKIPSTNASFKGHKLNQVVQNLYTKAAHIVIQARQPVAPVYNRGSTGKRLNKWFNIDTIETDAFREELRAWKSLEVSPTIFRNTLPLMIDVVLTTRDLTANQTLVLVDGDGNRIDIEKGGLRRKQDTNPIVLERWQVSWEAPESGVVPDLPVTYKKSIVVFRALYTLTRMLPAWRLRKRLARSKLVGNTLKVACQVQTAPDSDQRSLVSLSSSEIVNNFPSRLQKYELHKIETSAGRLCISVQYLTDCDFRVDDSEALLSSQFLSSDLSTTKLQQTSSLESARRVSRAGSYNTLNVSSASTIPSAYMTANDHRSTNPARTERRPSATFIQPFKTPSLSASPTLDPSLSSPRFLPRTPSTASIERLGARANSYTQSQRIPNSAGDTGGSLTVGSPRMQAPHVLKRYSSSFGQRSGSFISRRRTSQISDSAVQFEVSVHNSASHSSSVHGPDAHEQDLGDFVSMLDDRKPLMGTQFLNDRMIASKVLSQDSLIRGHDELEKYHKLKLCHTVLSDQISSSAILTTIQPYENVHKMAKLSPTTSSFSNASASPGKSSSPHIPAVPSKLSEFSILPGEHESLAAIDGQSENLRQARHMPESRSADSNTSILNTHLGYANTSGLETSMPDAQKKDMSVPVRDTRDSGETSATSSFIPGKLEKGAESAQHRVAFSSIAKQVPSRSPCGSRFTDSAWDQAESTNTTEQTKARETESSQSRINSFDGTNNSDAVLEDDDLFFAMSDIHLCSTKHSK